MMTSQGRDEFLYQYFLEPEIPTTPAHRAIRTDRFKLIDYLGVDKDELYDLVAPPPETDNLIQDPSHTDIVAELRSRLEALRARVGDL
jgi:N-acetylglucosamine-6-sulfatase